MDATLGTRGAPWGESPDNVDEWVPVPMDISDDTIEITPLMKAVIHQYQKQQTLPSWSIIIRQEVIPL